MGISRLHSCPRSNYSIKTLGFISVSNASIVAYLRIHLTHSAGIDDIESVQLLFESLNKKGALTTADTTIKVLHQINSWIIYPLLIKSFKVTEGLVIDFSMLDVL